MGTSGRDVKKIKKKMEAMTKCISLCSTETHGSFFPPAAPGSAAVWAGTDSSEEAVVLSRQKCLCSVFGFFFFPPLKLLASRPHLLSPSVHSGHFFFFFTKQRVCKKLKIGARIERDVSFMYLSAQRLRGPAVALGDRAHLRFGTHVLPFCGSPPPHSWDGTPKMDSSSWVHWEARGKTPAASSTTLSAASLSSSTATG